MYTPNYDNPLADKHNQELALALEAEKQKLYETYAKIMNTTVSTIRKVMAMNNWDNIVWTGDNERLFDEMLGLKMNLEDKYEEAGFKNLVAKFGKVGKQ